MSDETEILQGIAQQLAADAREREENREGWAKLIGLLLVVLAVVSVLGPFFWPVVLAIAISYFFGALIWTGIQEHKQTREKYLAFIGPRRPRNWRKDLIVFSALMAGLLVLHYLK
jgi:hypothetical protein